MSTASNAPGSAGDHDGSDGQAGEDAGLFQSHFWLTPVTVVVSIVVLFVAMVVLTWAAGGGNVFG
jgi:hypothetical protein